MDMFHNPSCVVSVITSHLLILPSQLDHVLPEARVYIIELADGTSADSDQVPYACSGTVDLGVQMTWLLGTLILSNRGSVTSPGGT